MNLTLKLSSLTLNISGLALNCPCISKLLQELVTKTDLDNTEKRINMNLEELKQIIATAAADNVEAFAEISTKIVDMQTQIDELLNNEVVLDDPDLLASVETLATTAAALADIVPDAPPVEPEPEPV